MQMCALVCYSDFSGLSEICFSDLTTFSHLLLFSPPSLSCPYLFCSLLILPLSLSLSLFSTPTVPMGLLWVYLSCFPRAHPMQFSLLSTFDFHRVSCPLLREQQERQWQGKKKCKKHCLSNFPLPLFDLQLLFITLQLSSLSLFFSVPLTL